jgi:hypothetical protein
MFEKMLRDNLAPLKAAADKVMGEFPPDFLLRAIGAQLKKLVFESVARDFDFPAFAKRLDLSEENARKVFDATLADIRKHY